MKDHINRLVLHNEIHARPPESIQGPMAISHLVMLYASSTKEESRAHLLELLSAHQLPTPSEQANHISVNFGIFSLRWELHTEFASWTFMRHASEQMLCVNAQAQTASDKVPKAWLEKLPGECLSKVHLWILPT